MNKKNPAGAEGLINWKQGFAIALGVPVLILPSIGYFSNYLGSFSIILWMIIIFQGFMQNLAYGELSSKYPKASGLPGFAQAVFNGTDKNSFSIFIGGFSAWGYWFAWNSVLAIFSLLIGEYIHGLFPIFYNTDPKILSLCAGAIIFCFLILINRKGVKGGAKIGSILAVFSVIPLFVISVAGILSSSFDITRIFQPLPYGWKFDLPHVMIMLGLMAMAQWSACAWETAAIYAPLYKNPRKDIPKALFSCGAVCVFSYFLVQTSCIGTLGTEGIASAPYSPMLTLSSLTMGYMGEIITIIMLLSAMILVIQTALLGSASTMEAMSQEGNLPQFFGKKNQYSVPTYAMISTSIFNLCLILLGNLTSVLAASATGYVIANGIALFAFVKDYKKHQNTGKENYFKAPKGWRFISLFFGIINLPLYFIGITMINIVDFGLGAELTGILVLGIYIPFWLYARYEKRKLKG